MNLFKKRSRWMQGLLDAESAVEMSSAQEVWYSFQLCQGICQDEYDRGYVAYLLNCEGELTDE